MSDRDSTKRLYSQRRPAVPGCLLATSLDAHGRRARRMMCAAPLGECGNFATGSAGGMRSLAMGSSRPGVSRIRRVVVRRANPGVRWGQVLLDHYSMETSSLSKKSRDRRGCLLSRVVSPGMQWGRHRVWLGPGRRAVRARSLFRVGPRERS